MRRMSDYIDVVLFIYLNNSSLSKGKLEIREGYTIYKYIVVVVGNQLNISTGSGKT